MKLERKCETVAIVYSIMMISLVFVDYYLL